MTKKWILLFCALAMALPVASEAAGKNELVVASWGGIFQKAQREAYFDPFEKATGIKVIDVSPPRAAKIKAMVESKNMEWDIVYAAAGIYGTCLRQGLVEKVDYKYFDKKTLDELYPECKKEYAVGNFYFSISMAYNTTVYSKENHPKNWVEFWDVKKFPGPRTLHDASVAGSGQWEFALLADGFPADQIYTNPDLERAFRKLKEIKPNVVKWWKEGQEGAQLLVDKEAVLGGPYDGRITKLRQDGAPVDVEFNQGLLQLEYMFIPKGAPNYENALKFMAFCSRAEPQVHFGKIYPNGPANKRVFEIVPQEQGRLMCSHPDNKKRMLLYGEDWMAANMEKVIERWNRWVLEK
jgi:putative spermidine/putrescine transport system substrate-binding protein